MTRASAPTKIILIGEHAVMYGVPAISLPVDLLTTVTIQKSHKDGITLNSNYSLSASTARELTEQVRVVLREVEKDENSNLEIRIELSVPPGIGLGVSASVSVALIKGVCQFFDVLLSQEKLFELVEKLEQMNHGISSGIDHTTIILNKSLVFQGSKEQGARSGESISNEKRKCISWQALPELWNKKILKNCYLMNTGKPEETTKEMVEFVTQRYEESPHETKTLFQKIQLMVPIVQSALRRGDQEVFRDILNEARAVLEELGIVSDQAQKLSAEIRRNGGMAKVSGAGGRKGSGSGILLVWHEEKNFVEEICEEYGCEYWPIAMTNESKMAPWSRQNFRKVKEIENSEFWR